MDWKDLFCNDWFIMLEAYSNRWGITFIGDGGAKVKIFDADLNRLVDTWESILADKLAAESVLDDEPGPDDEPITADLPRVVG